MVYTEKFSQFPAGNLTEAVGLSGDVNTRGQQSGSGGGVTEIITQPTGALMVGRWVRFDQGTNLYVHGLADTPQDAEIAGVVLNIISSSQFTLPGDGTTKYQLRFTYTSTSNVFVRKGTIPAVPGANTVGTEQYNEFRPGSDGSKRYAQGGDVIHLITPDATDYVGIAVVEVPY